VLSLTDYLPIDLYQDLSKAEVVAEASPEIAAPLRRVTPTATACRAVGCDKLAVGVGLYPRKGCCLLKNGGVFFALLP
jgi:hypothetical protein